jgi:hypothetical protein
MKQENEVAKATIASKGTVSSSADRFVDVNKKMLMPFGELTHG